MMAHSTVWLGREAERAADAWFRELVQWQPFQDDASPSIGAPGEADRAVCITCLRFRTHLQLEDLPHGALHSLAAPVSALVDGCLRTVASERYGKLLEEGWSIELTDGVVEVVPPDPDGVVLFVAQLRAELGELHSELLGLALQAVLRRRDAILEAARWNVEPVLRRLADELIREVCGS